MATNYSPKISTDGLILCLDAANPKSYPGSGTTWFDLSKNGNHAYGQDDGGASIDSLNFPIYETENNGRFLFDGSRSLIIPTNMGDHTTGAHEMWFYRNTSNANDYIADARNGTGSWWLTNYQSNDNIDIHGRLEADDPLPHTDNSNWWFRWLHVVIMSTDGSNSRLFINGEEILSPNIKDNQSLNMNLGSNFIIGGRYTASGRWIGYFSLYKIYSRELTPDEIKQNFNALRNRYGL
jgi:hypothetical protein